MKKDIKENKALRQTPVSGSVTISKTLRMSAEVVEFVELMAKAQNRSFNNMVDTLLKKEMNIREIASCDFDPCNHIWRHVIDSGGDYFFCASCGKRQKGFFLEGASMTDR